jgi:hypothetical protein
MTWVHTARRFIAFRLRCLSLFYAIESKKDMNRGPSNTQVRFNTLEKCKRRANATCFYALIAQTEKCYFITKLLSGERRSCLKNRHFAALYVFLFSI